MGGRGVPKPGTVDRKTRHLGLLHCKREVEPAMTEKIPWRKDEAGTTVSYEGEIDGYLGNPG